MRDLRCTTLERLRQTFPVAVEIADHSQIGVEKLAEWIDERRSAPCATILLENDGPLYCFFQSSSDATLFKLRWA